jgi:ABC-2 type transport system permease protein
VSDAVLTLRQLRYENLAFWRNPAAAFFTFAFPLMFLVIFNLLFGSRIIGPPGQRITTSTFYVPAIGAFSIIGATFTNLAISLSFSRDLGILKRVRGTPLPAGVYMMGRIVHSVLLSILLVALVTAFGALFYGVEVPTKTLPAALIALVVGGAAFSALGLAMTAVIPNADASPAIVNGTILPLLFISDVFIPLDEAPDWLGTVGDIFPVKHLSTAMQTAFNPFTTDAGFEWGDLAVIAAWGLAGLVLAIRFFSWEPRR